MGARGDVRPVLLFVGLEGIGPNPVVQRRIDLSEIPGVGEVDGHHANFGRWRHRNDVFLDALGKGAMSRRVEQLDAIDQGVLMLGERNRWAPLLPPPRPLP